MAKQFISDLNPGDVASSHFVVAEKVLRPFKGRPERYLAVVLSDRTGRIPARLWEGAEQVAQGFDEGDIVFVEGGVESYQGEKQIKLAAIRKASPEAVDLTDFLPSTDKDTAQLLKIVLGFAASVKDPHLRQLLEKFFGDPEFTRRFAEAPAAKERHHAYLGGMVEHVAASLQVGDAVCSVHPELNSDLVIAGLILHDIGKLYELDYTTRIEYTAEGQLIGHLILSYELTLKRIAQIPDFPEETKLLLSHIILSHHNDFAYGSPVVPKIPEAVAVHYIENCDAQLNQFFTRIRAARAEGRDFTPYDRSLGRSLYAGHRPTKANDQ